MVPRTPTASAILVDGGVSTPAPSADNADACVDHPIATPIAGVT